MIPVTVHGADGRMGRLVAELIATAPDCQLTALVTEPGGDRPATPETHGLPLVGQDRLARVHPAGAVIVDFSLAGALPGLLDQTCNLAAPLVIGTTGFTAEHHDLLRERSRTVPVLVAPNFSLGIPALMMVLRLLARVLPADFDAAQIETHHHTKQDRPSGTARWLAAGWRQERDGREAETSSQRLGGTIGEHRWTLADQEETLELTHRAHSRRAFLRGILPAVRFVSRAGAGYYGLQDVLTDLANQAGGEAEVGGGG
jgi:4-hydroxy-tetrahydrodipicolinate reductase